MRRPKLNSNRIEFELGSNASQPGALKMHCPNAFKNALKTQNKIISLFPS